MHELAEAEVVEVETPSIVEVVRPAGLYQQVMRFAMVGMVNTGVDLGVLNLLIALKPAGREGVWYSIFKTVAFLVAVTNSYLLNRRFTFKSEKAASATQLSQYLVVSAIGLIINVGVATLVVNHVHAPDVLLPYWPTLAAMAGIPFGLIWNFLGYRFLVF